MIEQGERGNTNEQQENKEKERWGRGVYEGTMGRGGEGRRVDYKQGKTKTERKDKKGREKTDRTVNKREECRD